jgi:hypothetical protein
VYVDDFKIAGPKNNIEKGWTLISQFLELDPPQPLNLYLGCVHEKQSVMIDGAAVNVMVYNMEDFLKSSLELYRNLFPNAASMATTSSMKVQTPCTPEDHQQAPAAVVSSEADVAEYASGDFLADESPKEFNVPAAKVIMKLMYCARMARPDLLRTISFLARYLAKWTEDTDKRLHKLMVYVQNSLAYRMYAWNDQSSADGPYKLRVYSDSDFAGCSQTQRSTTGSIVYLSRA